VARPTNKLTAIVVEKQARPGRHSDGGGLYLNVTKSRSKSWVFIWSSNHRKREMGLGPYPAVSLAKARTRAERCREQVADGLDPIVERGRDTGKTFGECADAYFEAMKSEWTHSKTHFKWHRALNHHCGPIRGRPVASIDTEDVLQVLNPIWQSKSETASKLRGRIERVLDFAKAKGWRAGENQARWRGHLQNILPKPQKLTRGHHPAMPYEDVPGFIERLHRSNAMSARAIEFLILTGMRTSEVLGAQWPEIDFDKAVWSVPAVRMKRKKVHRVPLSDRAVEIVLEQRTVRLSDYIFPGQVPKRPLSTGAMDALLNRMKIENATVHGFRSSFRDWCGEETGFPREIAEAALAHAIGNEVERAYRRGDALKKRRELMAAWADYCDGGSVSKIVALAP